VELVLVGVDQRSRRIELEVERDAAAPGLAVEQLEHSLDRRTSSHAAITAGRRQPSDSS